MPSGQLLDSSFPFSYASYPLPDLSALANNISQHAPTSPNECSGFDFFHGIVEDSKEIRPSSSSESSVISVPQYAALQAAPPEENAKVARPPNAWILYRSTKLAEYKEQNPHMYTGVKRTKSDRGTRPTQANMSKQIAELWAQEPAEVKDHFHREAMLKSVMHAVENPGYRFNPNKGRRNRSTKSRSSTKSGGESSAACTPPQASATAMVPSSAPAFSSQFGLAMPSPQRMQSWGSHTSNSSAPSSAQAFSSFGMDRTSSLHTQLEAIFPNEAVGSLVYSSSSASSAISSPPWTGGLMPALSIDNSRGFASASCTSPNTPFSESDMFSSSLSDYAISTPADSFSHYPTESPYYATAGTSYTFPSVQSAPTQQANFAFRQAPQQPPQTFKVEDTPAMSLNSEPSYPDWWPYRHIKVRPDEANGIPLEDLLRTLDEQK